jgi:hypothetical protein
MAAAEGDFTRQFVQSFGVFTPRRLDTSLFGSIVAGFSSSGQPIVLQPQNTSSGFAGGFQDTVDHRADQAHHFAAFLQVGYLLGTAAGDLLAKAFEAMEGTPFNEGDKALGAYAAELGAELRAGTLKSEDLGDKIRSTVCGH